ncbi:MAG TPA: YafY family protein [Nocardioidaceae bacterium]|nr:YafY family protein [Nocardioidaceae bacterium]
MAGSSARMLQLLSLLQTHRYWSGGELAGRLQVSARTLRRDVDRLRELGYPVDAVRGVAGGYQLQAGAALPPLLLDDEEAVAIAVGLRAAAGGMVAGIEETSVRALGKLVQVMPPRLRRRVDALQAYTVPVAFTGGPSFDAAVLSTLAMACRDDERLAFDYTTRDGESMRRSVEPHRLVSLGRRWYLVAYDLTRHDWRSFRVDRLSSPETTGARFRQRELPAGDAAAFVQQGITTAPQKHQVVVLVQASAADVTGVVGRWGAVEEVGEDVSRLRMQVDDLAWPMLVLASVGADFEVESPAELVERVHATGRLFSRAT